MTTNFSQFLDGFKAGAHLTTRQEADEQWAGFSRQMDDKEREELQEEGFAEGFAQGQEFRRLYASK